ncbi:MAG: SprT family zinc-dependent metalloprotease [Pseudomonadota bacterium]
MSTRTLPGSPPVEITLRRSARARRISLRVSSLDGRVTLSLPKRTSEQEALDFAASKEDWIRKHLSQHAASLTVGFGTVLPIEGADVTVRAGAVRSARREAGDLLVPPSEDMVAARVKAYLKLLARERLTRHATRYAKAVDRPLGRITLRDTRSRWGSCTSEGNLMFSWRLILAPPDVLDYVAAHEVAHLVEMNHSPAYWQVVAQIYPDYAAERAWLRKNGTTLHRYRFDD